jgi:dihydroflavonol-4-reductase
MASDNVRAVVVTGASGFLGRRLVARLQQDKSIEVRALLRPGKASIGPQSHLSQVNVYAGDITDPDSLAEVFDGAWGVVNLAGYRDFWSRSRRHYYRVNELGAYNVFSAAQRAGLARAVQVSTPLAYGMPAKVPFNEDSEPGVHASDYARSKYRGDCAAWHIYEEQGLPLNIVYLAAVIGAGDDRQTMEVRRTVEGKLPALVGADTIYTYVYIDDAVEAIARALLRTNTAGQRYLIGTERATTREYFNLIGELSGVAVPAWNIPEALLLPMARLMEWLSRRTGVRPLLPLDVLKTVAAGSLLFDGSRAISELGMTYRSLEYALAEAIAEIQG